MEKEGWVKVQEPCTVIDTFTVEDEVTQTTRVEKLSKRIVYDDRGFLMIKCVKSMSLKTNIKDGPQVLNKALYPAKKANRPSNTRKLLWKGSEKSEHCKGEEYFGEWRPRQEVDVCQRKKVHKRGKRSIRTPWKPKHSRYPAEHKIWNEYAKNFTDRSN